MEPLLTPAEQAALALALDALRRHLEADPPPSDGEIRAALARIAALAAGEASVPSAQDD